MNTTPAPPPSTLLPILTFEDAALAPSLGYVFDARWLDPHESLVSMLWKFAWVNGLAGHLVVAHVARRPVDPYDGIAATVEEVDIRRVARSLGVPGQMWMRRAGAARVRSCGSAPAACGAAITGWCISSGCRHDARCTAVNWRARAATAGQAAPGTSTPGCSVHPSGVRIAGAPTRQRTSSIASRWRDRCEWR